jgi:hypothetical protein
VTPSQVANAFKGLDIKSGAGSPAISIDWKKAQKELKKKKQDQDS